MKNLSRCGHRYMALLAVFGLTLLYCWRALSAEFIGGYDLISNLLPVVHYRHAIFVEHRLPFTTDLWYGGRPQWQNPLWNFLYLPATIVWLTLPLKIGTTCIVVGHFLLSGWAAVRLARHFSRSQLDCFVGALLLVSPIVVTLQLGHLEKLLAWPFVLYGLLRLLCGIDATSREAKRHHLFWAGLCLGIMPLTGSNYYALYATLLFSTLIIGQAWTVQNRFWLGASIGLFHLPSVAYLIGVPRQVSSQSIAWYRTSWAQTLDALFLRRPDGPMVNESFSIIGVGVGVLAVYFIFRPKNHVQIRLLLAASLLTLLSTATLYQWLPPLNAFRVPSRALAFVALALVTFVLYGLKITPFSGWQYWSARLLLLLSCLQILFVWVDVRPNGTPYWLHDGATTLAAHLDALNAKSVWFSTAQAGDMLIPLALNQRGIALPNVYYGGINQTIQATGHHCSFSFDYLILQERQPLSAVPLITSTFPQRYVGAIQPHNLRWQDTIIVNGTPRHLFAVVC